MKRPVFLVLLLVVLFAAIGSVTAQQAAKIEHVQLEGGDTFVCQAADNDGAPTLNYLYSHYWLNVNVWSLSDNRMRVSQVTHGEIINPATGQVLRDYNSLNDVYDFNDPSVVVDEWRGNMGHFFIPGAGMLGRNAGRLVLIFDATGPNWVLADVAFEAGRQDTLFTGFDYCAAMGAGTWIDLIDHYEEVTRVLG